MDDASNKVDKDALREHVANRDRTVTKRGRGETKLARTIG